MLVRIVLSGADDSHRMIDNDRASWLKSWFCGYHPGACNTHSKTVHYVSNKLRCPKATGAAVTAVLLCALNYPACRKQSLLSDGLSDASLCVLTHGTIALSQAPYNYFSSRTPDESNTPWVQSISRMLTGSLATQQRRCFTASCPEVALPCQRTNPPRSATPTQ